MLWVYFDELVARYQGRPATEEEIRESLLEDPSDDLAAPTGLNRREWSACPGLSSRCAPPAGTPSRSTTSAELAAGRSGICPTRPAGVLDRYGGHSFDSLRMEEEAP